MTDDEIRKRFSYLAREFECDWHKVAVRFAREVEARCREEKEAYPERCGRCDKPMDEEAKKPPGYHVPNTIGDPYWICAICGAEDAKAAERRVYMTPELIEMRDQAIDDLRSGKCEPMEPNDA